MRKFGGLLTLVVALGAGTAALANDNDDKGAAKTGVTTPAQGNQINKQIGFIDLYLTNAMNDAKVLSTLSEGEPARSDKALVSEAQKNLTTDIDRSLTHVQKLRGMKTELSMAGGSMGGSMGAAEPGKNPSTEAKGEMKV